MHRPRRARNGNTEGLAQHVGKALDLIDSGIELRHRLEGGNVVDLLVDLLEVGAGITSPCESNDWRMGEPSVAQAGCDIESANDLRRADAGPARGAGIAVGHVGGGFLAVACRHLMFVRRSISTKVRRSMAGTWNTWVTP